MTDRAKPKAKPPTTRTRRANRVNKDSTVVTLEIPSTKDPVEFREYVEKHYPDWPNLGPDQQDELVGLLMEQRGRADAVRVSLRPTDDSGNSFAIDMAGPSTILSLLKIQKAFGSHSLDAVNARSSDLLKYLGSVNAANDSRMNAALSFVEEMAPTDQAQAMLLVQAYTTHDAAIRALSQLGTSDWADHSRMYGNLANKLLRTFQGQMDTLMRMQRGNEQVIKHVYVDNRGGQAVFAENVSPRGGNGKGGNQPHAAYAIDGGASLPGSDPFGNGMPIPGGVGPEAVPHARRHQPRSANGQGERELSARRADEGGDGPAA